MKSKQEENEVKEINDMFNLTEDKKDGMLYKMKRIFYRICYYLRNDLFYDIKYLLQKLFRKHHSSDCDLYNLCYHLSNIILPKLIAFKEMNRIGYPFYFSEYSKDFMGGISKKEYNAMKKKDQIGGGEEEAWERVIDEMIFALEYNKLSEINKKELAKFFKKWNLINPYRETEDNLKWTYTYKTDNGIMICNEEDYNKIEIGEKEISNDYKLVGKSRSYIDNDLLTQYRDRAEEGMRLFGKFFWNLWD